MDGRDAAREGPATTARRQAESELRGDVRRTDRARPRCGSSAPAAGRTPATPRRCRDQPALHARPPRTTASRSRAPGRSRTGTRCQANYIRDTTDQTRAAVRASRSIRMSPRTRASRTGLFVASYNGVLTAKLLANVQVSQQEGRAFEAAAGSTPISIASPFLTQRRPMACRRAPLQRQLLRCHRPRGPRQQPVRRQPLVLPDHAAGTDRTTSRAASSTSRRTSTGGNSQSASGYVFDTDYLPAADGPGVRRSGRIIPTFMPGVDASSRTGSPTRGANLDIRTLSFYRAGQLGDQPQPDAEPRRPQRERARARRPAASSASTPTRRCRGSRPPTISIGNGGTSLQASYAHYAGKVQRAADRPQLAGRQSRGGDSTTTPARRARGATSHRASTSPTTRSCFGSFPTANIFLDAGLSSAGHPRVQRVGRPASSDQRGMAKLTYTNRALLQLHRGLHRRPDAVGPDGRRR